ncbi:hypothetical protein KFZ56_05815 [Virgibacillus sp. NKC19-3]|uniref:hypothetical protein n=1 Tax=Virgibacillus saliphilus TaxID=2831674 RepID=UPI001C9A4A74|nr:hypothetical protein [Virgibacillus sp. NKC19-3]MBY7142602.1 hypothetical protein [Virgibacillus sp. NKC19-3]
MNRPMKLESDEKIVSCLEGLFEIFDGIQNVYFGNLILTNKRLYLVSNKQINIEKSFWFSKARIDMASSVLIVGESDESSIKVKWIYKGNFHHFTQAFQKLSA